jgi:hypothetical protein
MRPPRESRHSEGVKSLRSSIILAFVVVCALLGISATPTQAAVKPNNFSISGPKVVPIGAGKSKTVRIVVKRGKGFAAPLAFQVASPLSGVVVEMGPVTSKSASVRLRADTTASAQTGTIQITATGGGLTKAVSITVKVAGGKGKPAQAAAPAAPSTQPAPPSTQPAPPSTTASPSTTALPVTPFELTALVAPAKAIPGSQVKVTVALVVPSSSSRPETKIRLVGLPAGATSNPTEITTSSNGTFTVQFPKDLAPGNYRITAQGVSGATTASANTDPVEIRTTPLLQLATGQSNTMLLIQGETKSARLFSAEIAGISPVKFSTAAVAQGATISFSPIDSNGISMMTVATTPQTPIQSLDVNVVGTGANGTTATLKVVVNILSNGQSLDFKMSSAFDADPKNKDGYLQIVPGFATNFTVSVRTTETTGSNLPPTVTIRFPASPDYTVTPQSATTSSDVTFLVTFNKVGGRTVTLQAIGTAGSIVHTTEKKIKVSAQPTWYEPSMYIVRSGTALPAVKAFTFSWKKVIGLPQPTFQLAGPSPTPGIVWTMGRPDPDGSANITVVVLGNVVPKGTYTLGSLVLTTDPGGLNPEVTTKLSVSLAVINPEDELVG